MAQLTQGSITVTYDDSIALQPDDGKKGDQEINELAKAYPDAGSAAQASAIAWRKNVSRIAVVGVTPDGLEQAGESSTSINGAYTDALTLAKIFQQANLRLDADAHRQLGRLNDAVKAAAKHDPTIWDQFPELKAYWAKKQTAKPTTP